MFEEHSWPRVGDVLFPPADEQPHTCNCGSGDPWRGYAEGYKQAADLLAQHVVEAQRDCDHLIYPIGFLYRHALEVLLKDILHRGGHGHRNGHDLLPLWQECRGVIEERCYAIERSDLDAAEAVIRQFADKDRESTVFRYPAHKDGRPSFPRDERINLKTLATVAGRAYALLSDLKCTVTAHLEEGM
jgi:hypothetical protein